MGIFDNFHNREHTYNPSSIERFVDAQDRDYDAALAEVRSGRKRSHWIWYIFPQLKGLGRSTFAKYYGISDKIEAIEYLSHHKLGKRLREITNTLLSMNDKSAREIFGELDAMKVRSSMTLFDAVSPNDIFAQVLDKYYNGSRCQITINLLRGPANISDALSYIGIDSSDFALKNSMFARPNHAPIHGIGHIYRTMIACAMLGELLQKPREGLLAFCGAYIHDLARRTDGKEPEHGANAVKYYFEKFATIWGKYNLSDNEREQVCQAVAQHSTHEWMRPGDDGYDVMAILKDADALDRCRIGDLQPDWLRYQESKLLIKPIKNIYHKSSRFNSDMDFRSFIKMVTR